MKQWTVRQRIVGSFSVILALMFVMGAIGYSQLRIVAGEVSTMLGDTLPGVYQMSELTRLYESGYALTLKHINQIEKPGMAGIETQIRDNRAATHRLIGAYAASPFNGPQDVSNFAQLLPAAKAYESEQDAVLKLSSNAQTKKAASARVRERLDPMYAALMTRMRAMVSFNNNEAQQSPARIQAAVDVAERRMLELFVIALVAAALCGVLLLRGITGKLRYAAAAADKIGSGDLSVDLPPNLAKDEIGSLTRSFERMVISLKDMAKGAELIAAGNLTAAIKPQSERDVMGNALADMIVRLSALVGEVQKSGIAVNSSVTEIAATAKQQQTTANETVSTVSEIGATSREITATSKELVKTMQGVASVAEQTATVAASGRAGLTQMESTMHSVTEAARSINEKLGVLSERAANITQVVTTISKVADQTNLLSLNAAIEAEKAGESGRGFSVVATEIRRLADQTALATFDIELMVKEIQSAVSAGVMGMDKFSDQVRRGMHDVQQVGGQFSQIIQQVQTLAPQVESVSEGMQAQSAGAEQITQALEQLTEAAQQTVESLRQSSLAIDDLNHVSLRLRDGVSGFTLRS